MGNPFGGLKDLKKTLDEAKDFWKQIEDADGEDINIFIKLYEDLNEIKQNIDFIKKALDIFDKRMENIFNEVKKNG